MISRKRLGALSLLVTGSLVFMLWLAGLLTWGKIQPGTAPAPPATFQGRLITVQESEIPQQLLVTATVTSKTLTSLSPQVRGRVSRIWVDAGSRVQAGQALLALSAPDIQARLSQAKAGVAQAQAHLTQVSRDYERYRRLLAEGAVSPREFEALEASFKAAQAAAAQAQGQVQEAVAVKDYTVLTAPRHGVIADRRAAVGDLAHPGQTLLTLYDPAELLIEGEVNDDYRGFLAAGTRVRLEIPAVGWHGEAVLQEIFPISASASRTFKVRTAIIAGEPAASPSAGPALVPGLFARLYLPLGQSLGFLIPQTALRQVGQLTMVEVIHDGRPSLRQIKPGRRLGDQVEVLSGLAPGEQVVLP